MISNVSQLPALRKGRNLKQLYLAYHDSIVGLPWLFCLLLAVGYQFYLGFTYNSNDTTNIYLQLGRGGSYALLIVFALLWIPVMRHFMGYVRRSFLADYLPLEYLKWMHRWLGHGLILLALIHGAFYLVYYGTLEEDFFDVLLGKEADIVRSMRTNMYEYVSDDEYIALMENWIAEGALEESYESVIRPILKEDCTKCHSRSSTMTYAIPELPLSYYEDVLRFTDNGVESRQFMINISGFLMFVIFFIIWLMSLAILRKRYYHYFQQTHRLAYIIPVLSLLHLPDFNWLIIPSCVLFIEYILSNHWYINQQCKAEIYPVTSSIVGLKIASAYKVKCLPGYHVQLRIPMFHPSEWHDFSLTGIKDEQGNIILKVRDQGDWTNRLKTLLCEKNISTVDLDVRGAFASSVAQAVNHNESVFIAGGIGITAFLSLLADIAQKKNLHKCVIVWVLREKEMLEWLLQFPVSVITHSRWYIYVTAHRQIIPLEKYVANIMFELLGKNVSENKGMNFRSQFVWQYCRPDWELLLTGLSLQFKQPHCFICGPERLTKAAYQSCREMGWRVNRVEG